MPKPHTKESFYEKISIGSGDDCWLWTASLNRPNGYGNIVWKGKRWKTHRLAWVLEFGDIPEGLEVCHKCDVKRCVRPSHLFLGTHADNMADMVRKGKSPNNKGDKNPNSKLTYAQVETIRQMYSNRTHTQHELSRLFGVCDATIHNAVTKRFWNYP